MKKAWWGMTQNVLFLLQQCWQAGLVGQTRKIAITACSYSQYCFLLRMGRAVWVGFERNGWEEWLYTYGKDSNEGGLY